MTITGLENDYYLSYNDIWIETKGFSNEVAFLDLKVKNTTTAKELKALRLYPSPTNNFIFNICLPIRSLMPVFDHVNLNSLQTFEITFDVKFGDSNIPNEILTLTKYFVRGGRNKNTNNEWFLKPSEELIVGRWIEWKGITLPSYPKRLQGPAIVDYMPNNIFKRNIRSLCSYKLLKFHNSIGGLQFYVFENWEIKTKTKSGKNIGIINTRLRQDSFKVVDNKTERIIEFTTKTPIEIQEVFSELTTSMDVFLYNPNGEDENAKWERLIPESNDSIENNYDRIFENKISFTFKNNLNKVI